MIGLARVFGRDVVAEGVETVEIGEALIRLGCDLAQGYGIARPMPAPNCPLAGRRGRIRVGWRSRSRLTPAARPGLNLVRCPPAQVRSGRGVFVLPRASGIRQTHDFIQRRQQSSVSAAAASLCICSSAS